MSIFVKFKLTEKRKIIPGDKAPIYVFETEGNEDIQLGKMKLRVKGKKAQQFLRAHDEFNVEIHPKKSK